jgi:hypothetical protein
MQIELDAVVHEYVVMSLASMKELVSPIQEERLQESIGIVASFADAGLDQA